MLLTYKDAESLKRAVCSPGGTTLAGIKALEDNNFHDVAKSAVLSAYKRTLELKK
jgi:pyrroline-5-carboxylate reductase